VERNAAARTWKVGESSGDTLNLPERLSRAEVFEHHLLVVARAGQLQLEAVTASEPLAFAHRNVSDEYALMLPTGDALLDSFQGRTFITDEAGRIVGRYKHGVGDLVLHPHGFAHWPGQLRSPHDMIVFAPGMRRRGLTLVVCASRPTPPAPDRPLRTMPGREADVKGEAPLHLIDVRGAADQIVAKIGDATVTLVVDRTALAPRGAYALDLKSLDLTWVKPGSSIVCRRSLVIESVGSDAEPPPPAWQASPPPAFAPFEDRPRGALPVEIGGLIVRAADDDRCVDVNGADVPRHWLARLLFRLALHGFRLGRVETYGGFFAADHDGGVTLGVPGAQAVATVADVERLYRAVAPDGYTERLS
jgi:hypothetical protein